MPDDEVAAYAKLGDGPAWDMATGEALTDAAALQNLLGKVRLTGATLARELLAAREALRFYADRYNYEADGCYGEECCGGCSMINGNIGMDNGEKARKCLPESP